MVVLSVSKDSVGIWRDWAVAQIRVEMPFCLDPGVSPAGTAPLTAGFVGRKSRVCLERRRIP